MLNRNSRFARGKPRTVAGFGILAVVMVFALGSAPGIAAAGEGQVTGRWGGAIDPEALQLLKGMTDYLGSLQEFTLHTENTFEDVLATGQKIQFGFATDIVVQRPNRIRAERIEGTAHQFFVYDGAKLTCTKPKETYFAAVDVPDNIDDFLHFARDSGSIWFRRPATWSFRTPSSC